MQIKQVSSHIPSSCWTFSHSYQVKAVVMLTSSNNLRLSSQPSFSSPRSTDLQNNLGPSAQNKEQVNVIRHSWMCCCLYISWATQQSSQKAYSSVSLAPSGWLAQTAWRAMKNWRQQQFSLICQNTNCSETAPISLEAQHHYPTSPPKNLCLLRIQLTGTVNQIGWKITAQ